MISQQYTVKDFGIHVDNQLPFINHVNQIVAKAHVRSRLIHRCFLSKDRSALVKAYVTYVRPLLEYETCIWSPYQSENICKVESVQRRFTKRLSGLKAKLHYAAVTAAVTTRHDLSATSP